ncbi:MAG: Rne/Rng family ribonuclease [Acidimicrobiia bacterium]|nr:Rne/Rng family ribonuclease [Acidimicrobiia bacterium]MBT8213586.1 Rne/Rng family ribonuclease [Acidimicrobiia bacterium]NNF68326.1 Rne/Rng family ribonuclease [Acidimicrobiia bacterium]NNK91374.1 Rne/Rng family ribonuclease [Acidimicrobiia bacterium]
MSIFRRKKPQVVRRGQKAPAQATAAPKKEAPKKGSRSKSGQQQNRARSNQNRRSGGQSSRSNRGGGGSSRRQPQQQRSQQSRSRGARRRPSHLEVVAPPETARKQMLVRTLPHQTQIVILEGPVLVEHYVARKDSKSLVGNIYLGKVRNVLPGMEAAFVDFGVGKNGVLYAGDVNYDAEGMSGKSKRIEAALKPGDAVLVQVVKDAMGHKGARLTNNVSLAGRYLVLTADPDVRGISRRLEDEERRRLRTIVNEVRPKDKGVIVRTAAEGASEEDIAADISRLADVWQDIEKLEANANAPEVLYEEPPLVIRVIREHFTNDFRRLLIDDKETHREVTDYLEGTEPDLAAKVQVYKDDMPVFERFHIEDQLRKALDRKVWLPSGGHIVIDRTEALTVIDVNTGKFVGHSNLEETVYQNNLESAEEIARQLRLRDIGGIIVIDFIDMENEGNQAKVLHRLREHLAKDKTRTQVFEVSSLGLVEMTRKNVSAGLLETFSQVCEKCNGRGVLLYEEAATEGKPIPAPAG